MQSQCGGSATRDHESPSWRQSRSAIRPWRSAAGTGGMRLRPRCLAASGLSACRHAGTRKAAWGGTRTDTKRPRHHCGAERSTRSTSNALRGSSPQSAAVREFSCAAKPRFVPGEAAKPAGCGGQAAAGETKFQARMRPERRNRRQAIRRARPLSWSRASATRICFEEQNPEAFGHEI